MITENVSLETLVKTLETWYPKVWPHVDVTTMVTSHQDEIELSPLLLDKFILSQALAEDRERFYDEVLFFLYSTSIINNEGLDLSQVPFLTSLEIAYSIVEVGRVFPLKEGYSIDVQAYTEEVLHEDGYRSRPWPFGFLEDPRLQGKEEPDKAKAIRLYIEYMDKLGS